MKLFNVILASDSDNLIGLDNKLPWKFDLDMEHFTTTTKPNSIFAHKNILIMGRRTWESFGCRVLPERINYVITSQEIEPRPNTLFFKDFYSAYVQASKSLGSVWVIGGSKIYDSALRFWACDKIYLTKISGSFANSEHGNSIHFSTDKYPIKWTDEIEYNDINKLTNLEHKLIFKVGRVTHGLEAQYLHLLHDVITTGAERETRNGITYSKFSHTLSWDLADGFPLLTTKRMFWKGIVEELLFFIRGDTDTTKLSKLGVKIWEPNTSREFLDSLGFVNYPVGEMGPMYGYQWRRFNGSDVDQLKKVIHEIKTNPHSRRLLMTDFNPLQAEQGVLYPCHSIILQFYVEDGRLSCNMYQRSQDIFLGASFNIASTSLLVHIIAQLTNLAVGKVHIMIGDYHVYKVHYAQSLTQLTRTPYDLPRLTMKPFETLAQVENSVLADYEIVDYQSHPTIKAPMVA
jgi:dihydrofolate reductase/thymidylate synthase